VSILLADASAVHIARVPLTSTSDWPDLEEQLSTAFTQHVTMVTTGLRTKRISKALEANGGGGELSPDCPTGFSLGLTVNSIKHYSIGKRNPDESFFTLSPFGRRKITPNGTHIHVTSCSLYLSKYLSLFLCFSFSLHSPSSPLLPALLPFSPHPSSASDMPKTSIVFMCATL